MYCVDEDQLHFYELTLNDDTQYSQGTTNIGVCRSDNILSKVI